MKKFLGLGFFLCHLLAVAQEEKPLQNAGIDKSMQQLQVDAFRKELSKKPQEAASLKSASEVMIIDPSTRAHDFKEAYSYLKSQKTGSNVFFQLSGGESLLNVLDLDVMKGGSLVIFKISTTSGLRYKVVRIEDISSIGVE